MLWVLCVRLFDVQFNSYATPSYAQKFMDKNICGWLQDCKHRECLVRK